MKQFVQNEEAVSPVIGVILMVAITVILAAVIAAFVFGMAGNMTTTKSVAATVHQQGTDITVTYQGGADANDVSALAWSINGTNQTGNAAFSSLTVGSTATNSSLTTAEAAGQQHIVVTATFYDGSSQVILDTYV